MKESKLCFDHSCFVPQKDSCSLSIFKKQKTSPNSNETFLAQLIRLLESGTCASGISLPVTCLMSPILDSPLPTTPPLQNLNNTKSATQFIQLGDTFPPISDPWRDDIPQYDQPIKRQLHTPDPSLFDQAMTASILDNSQVTETRLDSVSKDVLSEFDPLAVSAEEQAAHDAWETAESHPAPPPSSSSSSAPARDNQHPLELQIETVSLMESETSSSTPQSVSPTPSASFPSLAAFARTFSIPSFSPKSRPLSLDVAKPVASPSTLSSFFVQREQRAGDSEDKGSSVPSIAKPPVRSGASTPVVRDPCDGGGNGTKPTEGQFDFQKFLDQMKTRSAEPVSKYLRSCVPSPFFLCSD